MAYDYDIVIVGAGPAGLNAGYFAAKQGAKVLILDKKKELGKPVRCAEAVVENVLPDSEVKPSKDIVSNYVDSFKVVSSKGRILTLNINIHGYILNRTKFEQYLGYRAEKIGAEILLESTVIGFNQNKNKLTVTKNNGKSQRAITGKIIIGADGIESRIGRWAGMIPALNWSDVAVCYQYYLENLELEKRTVEMYWGQKFSPHGYIWVFPKSEDSANVGIVTVGQAKFDLKSYLDKFIKTRAPKGRVVRSGAGCVPQGIPPKHVVKNNILLIGDAARVAIPVTGAGIGHAMLSGKWAGGIVGDIIENNLGIEELSKFDKKMAKIRKKIAWAQQLKKKIQRDDSFLEFLFVIYTPSIYFHKMIPNFVEKFLLNKIRY